MRQRRIDVWKSIRIDVDGPEVDVNFHRGAK